MSPEAVTIMELSREKGRIGGCGGRGGGEEQLAKENAS